MVKEDYNKLIKLAEVNKQVKFTKLVRLFMNELKVFIQVIKSYELTNKIN